ncbi:aspartate/glutamate racemase family protein [Demequina salsinemoris]|uniref:aspartate/glutamate racemase family protein n=1 Tax=Demequina salsinemoris TaxID=577470 RepID=UPI0007835C4B|nr:amino acid racemase [Demequina salsinemoris]
MRTSPRRLGLLGGITWHSTLVYERLLHQGVAAAIPDRTADLVIRHYDFGDVGQSQHAGDWVGLARTFAADAKWLVAGGAEAIIICANTMHVAASSVQAAVDVPVIHMIDETAKAIKAQGLDTVALLGTGFTMRMPFYRERMAANGVTVLVPEEPELEQVHQLIYSKLTHGIVDDEGRDLVRDATARLVERGAQGVIAGCTEIPMVLTADDIDIPYFDSLEIHAEAALQFCLT